MVDRYWNSGRAWKPVDWPARRSKLEKRRRDGANADRPASAGCTGGADRKARYCAGAVLPGVESFSDVPIVRGLPERCLSSAREFRTQPHRPNGGRSHFRHSGPMCTAREADHIAPLRHAPRTRPHARATLRRAMLGAGGGAMTDGETDHGDGGARETVQWLRALERADAIKGVTSPTRLTEPWLRTPPAHRQTRVGWVEMLRIGTRLPWGKASRWSRTSQASPLGWAGRFLSPAEVVNGTGDTAGRRWDVRQRSRG